MKIEIKNWWTCSILFEGDFSSLAEAVVAAVKKGADLRSANLRGANLRGADLRGADLGGADLRSANLRSADLGSANLRSADFRSADLGGANLRSANLRSANLGGANLGGAKNAELAIASTRILSEGSIIGWKKLKGEIVAKLLIPETARRCHAFGRKCRADSAVVLALFDKDGKTFDGVGESSYETGFRYRTGATITPTKPFNEDYTDECSSGIHFFITRIEAENYVI